MKNHISAKKQTNEECYYVNTYEIVPKSSTLHAIIARAPGLNIDKNIENLSADIMEETLPNIDHLCFEVLIYGR